MRCWRAALLVVAFCALPSSAATYTSGSLATELRRLQQQTHEGRPISLPSSWEVDDSGAKYSISTHPLQTLVDARNLEGAAGWLGHLAGELEASTQPSADNPEARGKLDRILARREFQGVRPPSTLQLLWDRFTAWIRDLIESLFGIVNQHPTSSRILFWALVAGAAGMLLLWLIRRGNGEGTMLSLRGPHAPIPARAWAEWITAARLAADQGDLRQAMHCAYWAGVARLQETGALSADLTYTPREYLRLASNSSAIAAAPLSALTAGLERYWYAGRPATIEDFRASLKNLEALGCGFASESTNK